MRVNIDNLSHNYDSFQLSVKDFSVSSGERLLLKGKSGSGKSTFLKIICGITKAQNGQIFLDGINLADLALKQRLLKVLFRIIKLLLSIDLNNSYFFIVSYK